MGFARAASTDGERKNKPLLNELGGGRSSSRNHVTSETPESHIWWRDSAVQRAARLSDGECFRGGAVFQPNSVTQKRTGRADTTWPSRAPDFRSARIFGRSPSSTSSGSFARANGPPCEYGWWDQTSK